MSDAFAFTEPVWTTPRAQARIARRDRTMGRLFILFVVAIFAEGILRKWVIPGGAQKIFYFLRDPVILAIYIHYLRHYRINPRWVKPFLIYAMFIAILALLQNIYWQRGILTPLLGIRFYTFYLPLPFIMAEVMTRAQLRQILLLLLWAAIPVALLVMFQFSQPSTAWINKGTSDDGFVFTITGDIPRPYGPFTFTSGQTLFGAMMVAVCLACWERRRDLALPFWLVLSAGFATMVMVSLGGSRGGLISAGILMIFYVAAGLTSPKLAVGARRIVTIVLAATLAIMTFVVVFPQAYEAMSIRQTHAVRSEGSTAGRALSTITDVTHAYDYTPFGGFGLGAGSNGARASNGNTNYSQLAESEWPRMVNEGGPIFGTLLLMLRQCFALVLFLRCLRLNRKTGDGSAMIMMGFAALELGIGQATSDNQALTFTWFATGLVLAFLHNPQTSRRRR